MINKVLFRYGVVFLICFIACVTENNVQAQFSIKNWGVRFGLNAVSVTSYKAYQADEILQNSSYTNKNGYFLTVFKRFNINRMFLQPELAWNNYRRTCSFSLPLENSNSYYPSVDLSIHSKALNTNFLIGYDIVHDYPFLFGVFVGASIIGTYQTNFSIETEKMLPITGLSLNCSGILGFSINLSRLYFDLRYEMCLPNSSMALKEIPDFPDNYQNVTIIKTEAILSFSVGVMF